MDNNENESGGTVVIVDMSGVETRLDTWQETFEDWQDTIEEWRELDAHSALTTNFADYTVSEALLLLLFLCVLGSFLVRMIKGAFNWLAW